MESFNPSVGILFIQAYLVDANLSRSNLFQSLGRDSVHSSRVVVDGGKLVLVCFNPSVGILFIQAENDNYF